MVSPSASGNRWLFLSYSPDASRSRRKTVSRLALGSSMPMALRPCTTLMRQARADMERAMSSASATTRPCFTPGAGTSSYRVTTGPGRIWSIWPRTPNS